MKKVTKKTLQLSGMHCPSCSMLIEGALMDIGVAATCDFHKQVVTVEYDETIIHEEVIHKTISTQGYRIVQE